MARLDKNGLEHLWTHIVARLGEKVDKVDGKGLSTNDYTTDEKTKLAGIEEGATRITIDSALSSTSINPVQNKVINEEISKLNTFIGDTSVEEQINSAVSSKVSKFGDTMSGKLTIDALDYDKIIFKDTLTDENKYANIGIDLRNGVMTYLEINEDTTDKNFRRLALQDSANSANLDYALVVGQSIVTSDGSLAVGYNRVFHAGMETPIPIVNGGTGANSAPNALTSLGAVAKAGDTMGGKLVANATSVATLGTAQVRNIWAGTADISEVEGSLNEGDIYLQYEE